jgi:hypothetical protein
MSFAEFLTLAKQYGPWFAVSGVLGLVSWRLVLYIIKETVPRDLYKKESTEDLANMASAIRSNTAILEKVLLIVDERLPKGSRSGF